MTSSDIPFKLRGGKDQQTAIHNRIMAIERIKFLCGIDLRQKSASYLKALDLEMWQRWYKEEPPNKPIDEEFCQRAAEVVSAMEGKPLKFQKNKYEQARGEHQIKLEEEKNVIEQPQSGQKDAGKADEQKQDRVCQDPA